MSRCKLAQMQNIARPAFFTNIWHLTCKLPLRRLHGLCRPDFSEPLFVYRDKNSSDKCWQCHRNQTTDKKDERRKAREKLQKRDRENPLSCFCLGRRVLCPSSWIPLPSEDHMLRLGTPPDSSTLSDSTQPWESTFCPYYDHLYKGKRPLLQHTHLTSVVPTQYHGNS